jgi:hypothetical protein
MSITAPENRLLRLFLALSLVRRAVLPCYQPDTWGRHSYACLASSEYDEL